MRKIYVLLVLLCTYNYSWSQVSITASVGTAGPINYSSLQAAFNAINAGTHHGIIQVRISADVVEPASAVLNASGTGSSAYTSISIQPTGGARTINGDVDGALIDLDGADNVTIDGLNTGGNALTIINANNGASAAAIRFMNNATVNTITNTTMLSAGSSVTTATIVFSSGSTGNDNNTISNCNIADAAPNFPVNAILSAGSSLAGEENNNNTITGNNISNYFNAALTSTAILLGTGNTDWTISNNYFFQTASRTFTTGNTHRVIQVSSGSNHLITGNIIGYASAASTGTYTLGGAVTNKFVAIELAVGTGTATSVQNNTISNISFATTSNAGTTLFYGVWCGIYIISGNVNVGTITGNTIGSTTGTGSIAVNPTVNSAFVVGISSTSTGTVNIANNNIASIDLVPSGANAGTLTGINTVGAGGTINIINNNIGNAADNSMRIGTQGTTTQGGNVRGILNTNTGNVNINGNTLRNLVNFGTAATSIFRGIESQGGTGTISKNIISNISAGGTNQSFSTQVGIGLLVNSTSTGIVIDSNVIRNLNLTSTGITGAVVSGIFIGNASTSSGIVNGLIVTRNRIYDLTNTTASTSTTAPSAIVGIACGNSNSANPLTIANNMIGLGHAQTTNTAVIGIFSFYANAQSYTARIYHNSISIGGTVTTGAQPSFAYYRGDFSATSFNVPVVDIRNNIFSNTRSGGTGKHYAIANSYPNASNTTGWSSTASDYNILDGSANTIGYWSADRTFADWKTNSGGDGNSASVAVPFQNAPSDLHIVPGTGAASINNAGTALATVTNDIDNDIRSATTPDIGADEFTQPLPVTMEYFKGTKNTTNNLLAWRAFCSGSTSFEIERSADGKSFKAIGRISATKERCAAPFDFTDVAPADGINYYRLKMTDADGKSTYSSIIAIINHGNGVKIISLAPSIVTSTATLQVSSAQAGKLELTIFDIKGGLLHHQSLSVTAGSNTVKLDLSHFTAGSYLLNIVAADGSIETTRFVKK